MLVYLQHMALKFAFSNIQQQRPEAKFQYKKTAMGKNFLEKINYQASSMFVLDIVCRLQNIPWKFTIFSGWTASLGSPWTDKYQLQRGLVDLRGKQKDLASLMGYSGPGSRVQTGRLGGREGGHRTLYKSRSHGSTMCFVQY